MLLIAFTNGEAALVFCSNNWIESASDYQKYSL